MNKLPIAVGLSVVFALAGCSSSSSGAGGPASAPATTPPTSAAPVGAVGAAGIAAATKEIKKNWSIFFSSATPHSTSVSLLQNGANLGPAVKFAAKLAKAEKVKESAVVKTIKFPTPTTATLTYKLYGNKTGKPTGHALLPNANGTAVFDSGVWKVSEVTFCGLVSLGSGGKKVPGCS
jgi:hypothetical protein